MTMASLRVLRSRDSHTKTRPRYAPPAIDPVRLSRPDLWNRLQAHPFDAALGSEPYSVKLAQEALWSPNYTAVVIEEYRRFLYLTQIVDWRPKPPWAVEQAWNVHLTFSRNYWDVLCPDVLGCPLHFEPTQDEVRDQPSRAYAQTLDLYAETFGVAAPPKIWGAADKAGVEVPPKLPLALYQRVSRFLTLAGIGFFCQFVSSMRIGWRHSAFWACF